MGLKINYIIVLDNKEQYIVLKEASIMVKIFFGYGVKWTARSYFF